MRALRVSLLAAAAALAGACAPMSDADCRGTDWYALGERDALIYGLRPQIDQYAYQCSRYGVQPGEKEYLVGWSEGQQERGIRMGGDCCPN